MKKNEVEFLDEKQNQPKPVYEDFINLDDGAPEIMVLEDDPIVLRQLKSLIMNTLPFARVVGFDSSLEAIEWVRRQDRLPSLAILDVVLRQGTGIEFSRDLRKQFIGIPHFFISGLQHQDFVKIVSPISISPTYLEKPLDPFKLKNLLLHFLPDALAK